MLVETGRAKTGSRATDLVYRSLRPTVGGAKILAERTESKL